jgi:hypothetical protein
MYSFRLNSISEMCYSSVSNENDSKHNNKINIIYSFRLNSTGKMSCYSSVNKETHSKHNN